MTILRDLSVVWSLFHAIIIFVFLYDFRYSFRKTLILTGIFTAVSYTHLDVYKRQLYKRGP